MNKKTGFSLSNGIIIMIILLIFVTGFVFGIIFGIQAGQMMIFEGFGIALQGSNINLTIDVNETAIVDRVNETIIPQLIKVMGDKN